MEIYLAGGCFWGIEAYFGYIKGIKETDVGYANSKIPNPSYEMVCSGQTGATECVRLVYDANIITLEQILGEFFSIIDPTTINKQGNDIGTQYRSGIYFVNPNDEQIIKDFIIKIAPNYTKQIVTEVSRLENYYKAESYHQQYLRKNPSGYCHIDLSKFI
ncbi:peptide-methionine (S)-S-oxide reductase [Helicobacter sp. 16-1353]|uniref:peptide-methionine (S)-S-oxide reductase MsrA n=1 Tax=Helicobacter sp. 16-1353 TaxID=2004996 RepID=UPI000DCEE156|nr:peptide-methionine (S)-S-oxide reductase MsrA [Helicobacter sp. 16-1353]RAX54038.1 peptide-methionine (S)-S-oxide reductase [Helicobacter sp. 16-1353]